VRLDVVLELAESIYKYGGFLCCDRNLGKHDHGEEIKQRAYLVKGYS
jgi:hypothetical protein